MNVTRRDFIKMCGLSAATIGLSATDMFGIEQALANPQGPSVLWLQGAACTGCTESFLNRTSTAAPQSAADVLISTVNLLYHPNVMSAAGETAVSVVNQAYSKGGYILIVEGGVPAAFGGNACYAWSTNGKDVTFMQAVKDLSSRAAAIISVGTCASFGGMAATAPNPAGVKSVSAVTGKQTINIAGCPPHPDWIVWAIAQLLLKNTIARDSNGRPTAIYGRTVHSQCPFRERDEIETFGVDGYCLKELGCRGPQTYANCPKQLWNGGTNWCAGANAPCIGCTEPSFPGALVLSGGGDGGGDD